LFIFTSLLYQLMQINARLLRWTKPILIHKKNYYLTYSDTSFYPSSVGEMVLLPQLLQQCGLFFSSITPLITMAPKINMVI
jgi:hypothetical protein